MSDRSQWKMLQAELAQWASVNHVQGVKALYGT